MLGFNFAYTSHSRPGIGIGVGITYQIDSPCLAVARENGACHARLVQVGKGRWQKRGKRAWNVPSTDTPDASTLFYATGQLYCFLQVRARPIDWRLIT